MRRLMIWLGIFALTVWVTLRVLRALDQQPLNIPFSTDPLPPDTLQSSTPTEQQPDQQPVQQAQADAPQPRTSEISAYCAHCRERRALADVHEETTATGRRAARGTCSVCGTTVFTFLAAKPPATDT